MKKFLVIFNSNNRLNPIANFQLRDKFKWTGSVTDDFADSIVFPSFIKLGWHEKCYYAQSEGFGKQT